MTLATPTPVLHKHEQCTRQVALERTLTSPLPLTEADLPVFLAHVWADWIPVHEGHYVGGWTRLLRHEVTDQWAFLYLRYEPSFWFEPDGGPYDLNRHLADDTDADLRTALLAHTAATFIAPDPLALLDLSAAAIDAPGGWEHLADDEHAAYGQVYAQHVTTQTLLDGQDVLTPPPGLLTLPALAVTLTRCGLPEASQAATMLGLGAHHDVLTMATELELDDESDDEPEGMFVT